MSSLSIAEGLLREVEGKLKSLLSDAVSAGDYNDVVQIASWARSISEILNGRSPRQAQSQVRVHTDADKAQTPRRGPSGRRITRPQYPQFLRDDDRLIRVAWSKKERKEYEHRMPRGVLDALVTAMRAKGTDGRVFSMEDLLPLSDAEGNPIPSYQAYVALALLRHSALVDQHGRSGYSIAKPGQLSDSVDSLWRNLPVR